MHLDLATECSTFELVGRLVTALETTHFGLLAADLPKSLDPDSPYAEGKRLDPQDEKVQATLLRTLWQLVRSGSLLRAQQLCRRRGSNGSQLGLKPGVVGITAG